MKAWRSGDLYGFSERSEYLLDLLMDMELLLASDSRFLLGNWINDAKLKATNFNERVMKSGLSFCILKFLISSFVLKGNV